MARMNKVIGHQKARASPVNSETHKLIDFTVTLGRNYCISKVRRTVKITYIYQETIWLSSFSP